MILGTIKKNWFIIGIFFVIISARWFPDIGKKGGIFHPEITVKYIAVAVIFFNSGLSLQTQEFRTAIASYKIHIFIQCFTFIIYPLLITALVNLLQHVDVIDLPSQTGLLVLGCMPPPVSSAVILTKSVGGNEAAAIFNSALGSLLGIFLTPFLVLKILVSSSEEGVSGSPGQYSAVVQDLLFAVLIPIILGQMVRRLWLRNCIRNTRPPFGVMSSVILLFIIYSTFCDTFSHRITIDISNVVRLFIIVILIQSTLLYAIFRIFGRASGSSSRGDLITSFTARDVICLMFCSTHKSLTLGIPMIKLLFATSPHLSLISLPLLIYHPTQIVLGALLVPALTRWLKHQNSLLQRHKSEDV